MYANHAFSLRLIGINQHTHVDTKKCSVVEFVSNYLHVFVCVNIQVYDYIYRNIFL